MTRPRQNYRTGRAFEWAYRRHLVKAGYRVIRSAGSKGLFDLVYWRGKEDPHAVQLKRRGSCAEMERLWASLPRFGKCIGHAVHERKDGGFCEH
jgi:hypothetical protein